MSDPRLHLPDHLHSRKRALAYALMGGGVALLIAIALLLMFVDRSSGSSPSNGEHSVTLCHATQRPVDPFNEITVDVDAGGLKGGHDGDNHQNGEDIIPPFTYVDKDGRVHSFGGRNLSTRYGTSTGQQVLDNHCVIPETPPYDACPNLAGTQGAVPEGYVVDGQGNCVPRQAEDVCTNLDGNQTTVPDGYELVDGKCVAIPADVCPNIDGIQAVVPSDLVLDNTGACVKVPAANDVCPNLDGEQTALPTGTEQDASGNCVPVKGSETPGGSDTTPTGTTTTGTTPTTPNNVTTPTGSETTVTSTELPFTGSTLWPLGIAGSLLLIAGAALELAGRRSRQHR
jgi:hypothetical protein